MKAILTATWAALLFVTSLPASAAQPEPNAPRVKVDYSDLNLNAPHGVSTLDRRVTGAIRQVCDRPAFELRDKLEQRSCVRDVGTVARRDMQSAITTARQLPSATPTGTAAASVFDKTISSSRQQPWSRQTPIRKH